MKGVFILICLLFLSCNKESPDAKKIETSAVKAQTENPDKIVDEGASGIMIRDPESTVKVAEKYKILCNKDSTEVLILVTHPGDVENSTSEFKIKSNSEGYSYKPLDKIDHFESKRGIKLGMSVAEVQGILGHTDAILQKGNNTTLEYSMTSQSDSAFLKKMNMPAYFGRYKFEEGKLTEAYWGLEYP